MQRLHVIFVTALGGVHGFRLPPERPPLRVGRLLVALGMTLFAALPQGLAQRETSGTPADPPAQGQATLSNQKHPDVESGKYATVLRGLLSHSVPEIGVEDLRVMKGVVLLDAREPDEFAVSRLAGARYAGYDHFDLNMLGDLDRNQTVVVYCSVGYRSEKIAEKLLNAGFVQVYNLYGGIFEWVNAGQPVVDAAGRPTDRVHAYNRTWGLFLQRGDKVY
jgi:rhodanese-related sulfurtransferase